MYYREYFFYLKERLPETCYNVLQECYNNQKDDIEQNFHNLKNATTDVAIKNILLPIKENIYSMDYEILLREILIEPHPTEANCFRLDRFGIYLLHYLNN
ncbi:hypothetical protein [Cetobacterium sp.]|uniref:hypothetical protein n=1 Tax=Cetobacterium sp. TaxID=2071632 RepID=UPI002FC8C421